MAYSLYLGDCVSIVPTLGLDPKTTAVIADGPYGGNHDTDYTRFSGGLSPSRNYHAGIIGDDQPFDPSPWLSYKKVILWGYQYFAARVPLGSTLVWVKRRDSQLGTFLSDAELAWQKGGKGVYCKRIVWNGFDREVQRGEKTRHPTEKPCLLFSWCIQRLKLKPGDTVLDPYMGSGPCGVACLQAGINYIGIEISPHYHAMASARLAAVAQP